MYRRLMQRSPANQQEEVHYPHGVTVQDNYLVVDQDRNSDNDSTHSDNSPFATPNREVEQPSLEPTDNATTASTAPNATATSHSATLTPASLHTSIASLRSRLQSFQVSFNADIQSLWQQLAEVAISSENEGISSLSHRPSMKLARRH